jgi:AraC-like DNA-binding protein
MRPLEARGRPFKSDPVSISRVPVVALRPFVKLLWATDGRGAARGAGAREHVLPTGMTQVVLRLSPEPIVIFERGVLQPLGHAVIGGARSSYYVKDVSSPSAAVGAVLQPGALALLFHGPAGELAERHTRLDEVWGPDVARLREALAERRSLAARLDGFEDHLAARLPRVRALHPAIAESLAQLMGGGVRIQEIVPASGYSHRAFVALFRSAVGLAPKTFERVQRFQRAAQQLASAPATSLVAAALGAGYSDQAHLTRDFAELGGVSPARYRRLRLVAPNHVPLEPSAAGSPGQFSSRRRVPPRS